MFLPLQPGNMVREVLLVIALLLTSLPSLALEVKKELYNLGSELEYLIDNSGQLTFEQILKKHNIQQFVSAKQKKMGSLSPNTVLWMKLRLNFSEHSPGQRYYLSSVGSDYREINIYRPDVDGNYSEYITGNQFPADQREVSGGSFSFKLDKVMGNSTIYIRVVSGSTLSLSHWLLLEEQRFNRANSNYQTFNFLSLGALLGVMLFSAGIGATLKNRNYFFYSGYILSGLLLLMTLDGHGFYWLWPNSPAFNIVAPSIFTLCVAYFRLLTIYGFLEIQTLSSSLGRITRYWLVFFGLLLIGAFFGLFTILPTIVSAALWGLSLIYGIFLMVYAIRAKAPLAKSICLVLLIPLLGSVLQALSVVGIFELGAKVTPLAKTAFLAHAFLFSIIIARKIIVEERGAQDAQHDDLTGLENFNLTEANFNRSVAMANRYRWNILVLFIDLDKFKPVNDTYGHEVGDLLLQEVSKRILACMRKVDFVCRIGGDEFLVIETQFRNQKRKKHRAEKIVEALSKPFNIQGHSIDIGASVGIAEYPKDGQQLEELMNAADNAMYRVKHEGRNGVAVYK